MRFWCLALVPLLAGCNFAQSETWVDDCEKAFMLRVKSPATYERIDVQEYETPLSLTEYLESQDGLTQTEINALTESRRQFVRHTVLITFDAQNGFGALLRDKFYCDAVTEAGTKPIGGREDYALQLMKVNGQSHQELILSSLQSELSAPTPQETMRESPPRPRPYSGAASRAKTDRVEQGN